MVRLGRRRAMADCDWCGGRRVGRRGGGAGLDCDPTLTPVETVLSGRCRSARCVCFRVGTPLRLAQVEGVVAR